MSDDGYGGGAGDDFDYEGPGYVLSYACTHVGNPNCRCRFNDDTFVCTLLSLHFVQSSETTRFLSLSACIFLGHNL